MIDDLQYTWYGFCERSRHTAVCHVAQKMGGCKLSEYIDETNKVAIFTHMYTSSHCTVN